MTNIIVDQTKLLFALAIIITGGCLIYYHLVGDGKIHTSEEVKGGKKVKEDENL